MVTPVALLTRMPTLPAVMKPGSRKILNLFRSSVLPLAVILRPHDPDVQPSGPLSFAVVSSPKASGVNVAPQAIGATFSEGSR